MGLAAASSDHKAPVDAEKSGTTAHLSFIDQDTTLPTSAAGEHKAGSVSHNGTLPESRSRLSVDKPAQRHSSHHHRPHRPRLVLLNESDVYGARNLLFTDRIT